MFYDATFEGVLVSRSKVMASFRFYANFCASHALTCLSWESWGATPQTLEGKQSQQRVRAFCLL